MMTMTEECLTSIGIEEVPNDQFKAWVLAIFLRTESLLLKVVDARVWWTLPETRQKLKSKFNSDNDYEIEVSDEVETKILQDSEFMWSYFEDTGEFSQEPTNTLTGFIYFTNLYFFKFLRIMCAFDGSQANVLSVIKSHLDYLENIEMLAEDVGMDDQGVFSCASNWLRLDLTQAKSGSNDFSQRIDVPLPSEFLFYLRGERGTVAGNVIPKPENRHFGLYDDYYE